MAIFKKENKCVDEDVEKRQLSYTVSANADSATIRNNMEAPKKLKI